MSLQDCAAAAVATFPVAIVQTPAGPMPLRVVMVAIAGAESTWRDKAAGDFGVGGRAQCAGYTSFGLWQVNTIHAAYLASATGSQNACSWAAWLEVPANCARAALAVYASQGLGAWTTYQDGRWRAYLAQAQQAVAAAEGPPPPPPPRSGRVSLRSTALLPAASAVLVAAGLAVVLIGAGVAEE